MKAPHLDKVLTAIAIGDAFGAGYEMIPRIQIPEVFDFTGYRQNTKISTVPPGHYTDDTQMSLAIAELLVEGEGITRKNLANRFVRNFKRDPVNGYARNFQKFLSEVQSGEEFLEKIRPDSIKNGALMRSIPLGISESIPVVVKNAKTNSEVTHNTTIGFISSAVTGLLARYFFHGFFDGKNQAEVIERLSIQLLLHESDEAKVFSRYIESISRIKNLENPEERTILFGEGNEDFGVRCHGMYTFGAILYIVMNYHDNITEALKQSIFLGGDTDSVAISIGIIASRTGIDDLPKFLLRDLQGGPYGKDYIANLGRKFAQL